MKKIVLCIIALMMVLGLCACTTANTSDNPSAEKAEWEKFIDDYNKWTDEYVEIVNKYKANPTDTSILTDYTEMTSEVTEWADKADTITEELSNSPSDAAKFAEELLKISNKLAKAAQ